MKICGIVAEYNPFHKGHAYQIEMARKAGATHVMAVMSGNFVQRGAPAMAEKHLRAKMALLGGADLVVELPLPFSLASAEAFAHGAVSLMQQSGCVDMISFGAEDDQDALTAALQGLLSPRFDELLQAELKKGDSYAAARTRAVAAIAGDTAAQVLTKPNNILGVEYQKAAAKLDFHPQFVPVKRVGADHDSDLGCGGYLSASRIRTLIEKGSHHEAKSAIPDGAWPILEEALAADQVPVTGKKLEQAVLSSLRRLSAADLSRLPDMRAGLENRFYGAVRQASSLDELYGLIRSKRYPEARARRMVWQAFLGVAETLQRSCPPYIRVLGMNRKGEEILRAIKEKGSLPVSASLLRLAETSPEAKAFAQLEAAAADQYVLGMPQILPCGYDLTAAIVKE